MLDELAVNVLETAASDPELRRLLLQVEAALYDAAATASCLMEGWSTAGADFMDMSLIRGMSRGDHLNRRRRFAVTSYEKGAALEI